MEKAVEQRFPTAYDIDTFARRFKRKYPDEFEAARQMFTMFVEPVINYEERPNQASFRQLNASFSEWLVFDFVPLKGKTLIQQLAKKDPSLKEFSKTQFYSRFWVIEQDVDQETTLLRDVETCGDFLVHDPGLIRRDRPLPGTVGTRIARVGDTWRLAGQMQFYDMSRDEDEIPPCDEKVTKGSYDSVYFISEVESVIGINGQFTDKVTGFHTAG